MKFNEIVGLDESSGYTLPGSFTADLVFSKLWLIKELAKIKSKIDTMYVLGSWYGNLAILIEKSQDIKVQHIVNVETNSKFLKIGEKLLQHFGVDNTESMLKNANDLDYRQLGTNGVVINTSLTDMQGTDWFRNIPAGTLVALQARDHDPGNKFSSPQDIQRKFPLSQVLYSGEFDLQDPETKYTRFMIIGIK